MGSHNQKCSDEEFIELFRQNGATETSKILGQPVRAVFGRRSRLQKALDIRINAPLHPQQTGGFETDYPERRHFTLKDGVLMAISDTHYYPGYIPTAHRGFCAIPKELKPKLVCLNGDALDFPQISRHAPIAWNRKPKVNEELEVVDERTYEIRQAAKGAEFYWNLGNHDYRFENRLADKSPEYRDVEGSRLSDHFPHWDMGVSLWINNDLVIKHRFKGGIHATHNNTLWAGKSMLTGHLHSLKVTPFTDYNGTRYGIDSGTGNDPHGPHTDYVEDNPLNHRSGFIVLTFKGGVLLWPEIAAVVDKNHVQFRGEIIKV